jgi:hypothetical protein
MVAAAANRPEVPRISIHSAAVRELDVTSTLQVPGGAEIAAGYQGQSVAPVGLVSGDPRPGVLGLDEGQVLDLPGARGPALPDGLYVETIRVEIDAEDRDYLITEMSIRPFEVRGGRVMPLSIPEYSRRVIPLEAGPNGTLEVRMAVEPLSPEEVSQP